MALGEGVRDDILGEMKAVDAVTSIHNEIQSSVLTYLLAASPRGTGVAATGHKDITYTQAQGTVLSPWYGCISQSLEITSPHSSLGTPKVTSPTVSAAVMPTSSSSVRYTHALSPSRKRVGAPSPRSPEAYHLAHEQCLPDLEVDCSTTGRNCGASSEAARLLDAVAKEAKVDMESLGSPPLSFFALAKASSAERKTLASRVSPWMCRSKPPRHPRSFRAVLPTREGSRGGALSGSPVPLTLEELVENPPFRLLACLLLLCFTVLVVFGGHH